MKIHYKSGALCGAIFAAVMPVLGLVLIIALTVLTPGRAASAGPEEQEEGVVDINPHEAGKKSCSSCHAPEPPMLRFDAVTTCTKCHPNMIGNHPVTRHPIGQMPKMSIPVILPLTDSGEMVCSTCHDPHNRSRFKKMLRVDYYKLCTYCHKGY